MKKKDIPQDESFFEDAEKGELCYAVNEKGEYVTGNSKGWDPKKVALDNALEEIEKRVAEAKKRVLDGESSPVEYYMELNKMDLGILASYTGLLRFRVKRHMKPKVFDKLSEKILQRYADVFNITIEELKVVK